MNRSTFLKMVPPVAASAIFLGEHRRRYPHVGYLSHEMKSSGQVDRVLLDGRKVEHVIELDDRAGWLRRYVLNEQGDIVWRPEEEEPATEIVHGMVEVAFKRRG